jgi:hypothetical protein
MDEWTPQSCTLPTAEQPLRNAEFDELFRTAVRDVVREDPARLRLTLTPTEAVAATAAGLVQRETECCSFFTFTLTASGDGLALSVTVPPAHVEVLDAIASRAGPLIGAAS